MKGFAAAVLAATVASSVAVPFVKRKDAADISPGDGRSSTLTVKDPVSNLSIANPNYRVISDFDYASFNLGLYQEWIELDLFHYGLATFSDAEFDEAGINADYRSLLQFMANQETAHAQLLSDILGPGAAKRCEYNYTGAFSNVREYVDFNQRLTRWGESGVWGFLAKLNSKPSAQLLSQSIATEARQQMIFRQFTGAQAMDVFFEPGTPQSWQWTLLAPFISSCPIDTPPIGWSNYPTLNVVDSPVLHYNGSQAAVSTNRSALIQPNQTFHFTWEDAGMKVGPNNSYTTVQTGGTTPKWAVWVHQLNASFSPFISTGPNSGYAVLPSGPVYNTSISNTGPAINGTGFVALVTGPNLYTPYNLSMIVNHMVAGPAIFQSG